MRILGMVTHTHDTGVALLNNGIPEIVIEEERLNREKKTLRFPQHALDAALTQRGLSLGDVDCITMPWHIPTFWRTLAWAMLRKFPKSRSRGLNREATGTLLYFPWRLSPGISPR